jgi:hypothetical protein
MPAAAIPWEVKAVLGKAGALRLWEDLWNDGLTIGIGIGVAGTLIAVLFLALLLVAGLSFVLWIRGRR